MHQALKSPLAEIVRERRRRDHDAGPGIVKAPQKRIGHGFRYPRAGRDIFRKSCVIARREEPLGAQAIAARGKADRAFRRDVNMVDRGPLQPFRDGPRGGEGEPISA